MFNQVILENIKSNARNLTAFMNGHLEEINRIMIMAPVL